MTADGPKEPPRFADVLRRYRHAAGLSQEALAERAGVSARAISDLERGLHAAPQRETLALLLKALPLAGDERSALEAAARRPSRSRVGDRARETSIGSREAFPAARIPVPLDGLIGRDDDLVTVSAWLRDPTARLVTVTGTAGTGKTRLAIAAATELRRAFPDGVAFAALAAITDFRLVMPGVAQALGVRQGAAQEVIDLIAGALRGRRVLLVLDNFEHVLPAGPDVLALLARAPELSILATSRAPLRLRGERRYPLAPFAAPNPNNGIDPAWFSESPAVTLFVRRAQAVDPDFALTPDNSAAVAAICHYLDGLPLAIELAAARSAILPPAAMLSRLPGALPLLTGGARDAPRRHRTLRDAIAWSYGLLSDEEQRLFCALAVFVGGWTLEAAEWVAGDSTLRQLTTLDAVAGLVEHNLARLDHRSGGEPRYAMLETVREFAVAMATECGDMAEWRRRHAEWYGRLFRGGEMRNWEPRTRDERQTFSEEIGNIRAAFDWLLEANAIEEAGWMALILIGWLNREARFLEAPPLLWRVLARREELSPGLHGLLTANLAYGLFMQNDPSALPMAYQAIAMQQTLSGTPDFDPVKLAITIVIAGHCADDSVEVRRLYEEAIRICRGEGEEFWQANALVNLGGAYWEIGEQEKAVPSIEEGMRLYRRLGTEYGLAYAETSLANLLRQQQEPHAASEHYRRATAVFAELGDIWWVAVGLEGLAAIAMERQPARAAWLYGAAAELRARCGGEVEPYWWGRTATTYSDLQAALGQAALAEAYDGGAHATLDTMVQVVLGEVYPVAGRRAGQRAS